ncbi:Cytochrome P450 OS=Streptomyces alboniger OX=132473 GN=CP975_32605 PE=3 SV=1 [Streptomyces alboniger]
MSTHPRQLRDFPFDPPDGLQMEPLFAQLRRSEPVSRIRLPHGGTAWLVTRYQDIKTVLGDPRFGRAATQHAQAPRIQADPAGEGLLMGLDPPDHTRLRKAVAGAFTKRRVKDLQPTTELIAEGLLTEMEANGPPADLVASYALPLPVTVISDLLGVPAQDRGQLRSWSDALLSTTDNPAADAAEAMVDYFTHLVRYRRRKPADDLLSSLVCRQHQGQERLDEQELALLTRDLLVAGHETTASQIANSTYVLLGHPAQMKCLRRDPSRWPTALEELLRFVPLGSGGYRARVAAESVELGGVHIEAGDTVFAPTAAANRDPDMFTAPDCLDIIRTPNPHLAFGYGVHHCLGAQLARLELQVALAALVRRWPHLRPACGEREIEWKSGMQVRGPKSLMVRW